MSVPGSGKSHSVSALSATACPTNRPLIRWLSDDSVQTILCENRETRPRPLGRGSLSFGQWTARKTCAPNGRPLMSSYQLFSGLSRFLRSSKTAVCPGSSFAITTLSPWWYTVTTRVDISLLSASHGGNVVRRPEKVARMLSPTKKFKFL